MIGLIDTGVVPIHSIWIVLAGVGILAVIDAWRERVENWATGVLLLVVIAGLSLEGIAASQWVGGILAAAIAFSVYLWLGTRGVMGGGDVKLSVVPALVLGAVSPWLAIWWVLAANALHQVALVAAARWVQPVSGGSVRTAVAMPHVPAMAVAIYASVALFGLA